MQSKNAKRKSAIERRQLNLQKYEKQLSGLKDEAMIESMKDKINCAKQDIKNTQAKLTSKE